MDTVIYNGKEHIKFSIGEIIFDCVSTWTINAGVHELIITVNDKNDYFDIFKLRCGGQFFPEWLYLTSNTGEKISLFQCFVEKIEYCNDTIFLTYDFLIVGSHVGDIFDDNCQICKSLRFSIESTPIPLVSYIPYGRKEFIIKDNTIEFNVEKNGFVNVDVEITALTKNVCFNQIASMFYEIMDIIFLCLGFYPYTTREQITLSENSDILLFHRNKNKLEKGKSESHWCDILVLPENINYDDSFIAFNNKFGPHNIVIEVLTNAMHSCDLFSDLKLSIILQCVEGYMSKWHDVNKFDDSIKNNISDYLCDCMKKTDLDLTDELLPKVLKSIKNMLGNINKQSFEERINAAFELNELTSMIVVYEKSHQLYDDFLVKSKFIRNQFAHMNKKEKVFHDKELWLPMEKYILLLRVLILSDLGIIIDKQKLEERITSINGFYENNT